MHTDLFLLGTTLASFPCDPSPSDPSPSPSAFVLPPSPILCKQHHQKMSPDIKITTKPPLSKNVDQQRNRNNNWHEQCTSTQASENQCCFVVLVHCRRTHLLLDQKHQQSPRRGLEGTHLPEISKSERIINLTPLPHVF